MALPKQVQQDLEEADRIQQQLTQGTPPADEPQDTPPETAPPDLPPYEPPVSAAPEPTPAQPADDGWKQRYETLRGKYDAEVGRLNEANRSMTAQMQTLQQQMAQLTQRPPEPQKAPDPLVTSQDEEKFGSDLVDFARRVVREEVRSLGQRLDQLEALAKTISSKASRVDQVEQEVAQTRQDAFWKELAAAVPKWEEINQDERWLKWLTEYDPIAGRVRQEALVEAQRQLNHQRVAAMFKAFLSQFSQAAQPHHGQAELARQVAPARSSKTTVQPQQPKMMTGREYNHWLDPRRVHDTDPAKLQAMIAEVERAFAENRIQW